MKNYICFGGRFRVKYAYIDTHNYLAVSLFYKHKVSVRFKDEYAKDGENYRVIFCSIKQKDKENFEKALLELQNKMLICGQLDYENYCNEIMEWMKQYEEK